MRKRFALLFMVLLLRPAAAAEPWPYPDQLRDRLVWVHPLVNYAFDPRWQRAWERELVRGNGVRTTVGSVATDDLATSLQVNVCEPLGERFRFLYRMDWRDALHVDVVEQQHWLGFGGDLLPRLAVELQAHPTADKEHFDLRAGVLLTSEDRSEYVRFAVRWDDFLYTQKNDRGGIAQDKAVALQWELRWAVGRWEIASEGLYGSPWSRIYPDTVRSPDLASAAGRRGEGAVRLRRLFAADGFAEAGLSHYRFHAAEAWRDPQESFDYANEWLHAHALAVIEVSSRVDLRPEFHWLRQWASASGRRAFSHRREDVFPAVFLQLKGDGRSTWELGYMTAHYAWDHGGVESSGTTDKIKFGWTIAFTPRAALQLSLSHERDLDRFGGGNVQYQMLF